MVSANRRSSDDFVRLDEVQNASTSNSGSTKLQSRTPPSTIISASETIGTFSQTAIRGRTVASDTTQFSSLARSHDTISLGRTKSQGGAENLVESSTQDSTHTVLVEPRSKVVILKVRWLSQARATRTGPSGQSPLAACISTHQVEMIDLTTPPATPPSLKRLRPIRPEPKTRPVGDLPMPILEHTAYAAAAPSSSMMTRGRKRALDQMLEGAV
jgi:hypothetical protein